MIVDEQNVDKISTPHNEKHTWQQQSWSRKKAEYDLNDGFINVTPIGGTGEYVYQWIGPNDFNSMDQNITNNLQNTDFRVVL